MAELATVLTNELGLSDVPKYIQSGDVVLTHGGSDLVVDRARASNRRIQLIIDARPTLNP